MDDAQARLDAAKRLAEAARQLREEAADAAKRKIDEASDAGMRKKKWYEKVVDFVADHWDDIVAVCKVVVAVLGVVVMIIGRPLAWVVLVAALVVLADTLLRYLRGKASLWDVAFAALDCVPGFKGLTTVAGVAALAKGGLKTLGKARRHLAETADTVRGIKGSTRMQGGLIPYRELSPKARHLARALRQNGRIRIRPGEVRISHLVELQKFEDVEHAVIQNPAGELVLFKGTKTSSSIPNDLLREDYRFIAHTHPEDRVPGPPTELEKRLGSVTRDSMALDLMSKNSPHIEVVISRSGQTRFFDNNGIIDVPQGRFPQGGPVNDWGFIVPVKGLS